MNRIIWHWTGGAHTANASDKRHYHFIIEGDGTVVAGNHPPEANATIHSPRDGSTYAAHTRGLNTGSIGIALAAMRGATERPFNAGPSPITQAQVDALVALTARLCGQYAIPVQRDTVLTHAEVQQTLKVAQRGKIDIMWLPSMTRTGDPVAIGDGLRDRVIDALSHNQFDAPASGPIAWLLRLFFGGKK
jgi:N-acetyl-anhydromuramyl-L-alanine amidase AmpD